jgi:anti-sigma B factor antagonist
MAFLRAASFSHERASMLKGWLLSERGGGTVGQLVSLNIEAGSHGKTIRVAGEIDLETAPELRRCFRALAGDSVLTVDLAEVAFLDSTAISVLIAEHKRRVAAGEQLIVIGSTPMALRLFELTGVDQVLHLD